MATFVCDHCQHTTSAPDAYVGRLAKCPKCDQRSTIRDNPPLSPRRSRQPAVTFATIPSPSAAPLPTGDTIPEAESAAERSEVDPAPVYVTRTTPAPRLPGLAAAIIAVAYILLGAGTLLGVFLFFTVMREAKTAINEAAAAASFGALFVAGYVLTRCVEKFVRAVVGL